jgi:hypothetical protein
VIISHPENLDPEIVGHFDTQGTTRDVFVQGDYAYLADWDGDLKIVDVSDPANPELTAYCDIGYPCYSIQVSGDYAYVGSIGIIVIDISDPMASKIIAACSTGGLTYDLFMSGDQLFAAAISGDSRYSGLKVIDISDPYHLYEAGFFHTSERPFGVSALGDYAIVADDELGINIIDVSDRDNITKAGFYDTPGSANKVFVSDGLIFVADRSNLGIYRLTLNSVDDKITTDLPELFSLNPAYPNPFNSTAMISFNLNTPSMLSLTVYDMTGRQVASLHDGYLPTGVHRSAFNAEGLTSGVYLIKAAAAGQVMTQEVVLTR